MPEAPGASRGGAPEAHRADRSIFLAAHSGWMGAAADNHCQDHQRGGDADPDQGRQGHHPGADERVQGLLQPLRPGTAPSGCLKGNSGDIRVCLE